MTLSIKSNTLKVQFYLSTFSRNMTKPTRTIIQGAAGRDFHNFNLVYRDNPAYQVIAFTATQIPDIVDRRYPARGFFFGNHPPE